MRYQVKYVEKIKSWAVVDSKVGDRVLALHDQKKSADDAAWYEEERWYKCTPIQNGEAA
ncbi:MAG: hypothetical protein HOL66_13555 [Rhodospirillaceae bacterium]|jgi:hypothetical protein|nr:hypothetical protein [Rhodospirillaceae bacterium]MBT5245257.1 hypothetical protein [Rhodospirillaceae bacterium]MBT5563075.1 hypothetical protein [Rhodospirillaceae bacterium]MBT6241403.1 hypothetical protein [Rhodospirillaceae bacterium]MBT7138105.1 hypothetical protein [Rhodospirillaceae bacterium]